MKTPPIVSSAEWEAARQQILVKEKALTRARDALAAERRRMPGWRPTHHNAASARCRQVLGWLRASPLDEAVPQNPINKHGATAKAVVFCLAGT
jgi:hypothetical protein